MEEEDGELTVTEMHFFWQSPRAPVADFLFKYNSIQYIKEEGLTSCYKIKYLSKNYASSPLAICQLFCVQIPLFISFKKVVQNRC